METKNVVVVEWSQEEPTIQFAERIWFPNAKVTGEWVTAEGDRLSSDGAGSCGKINYRALLGTMDILGVLEMLEKVAKTPSLLRFFYKSLKGDQSSERAIVQLLDSEEQLYIESTGDLSGFSNKLD
ncbi:hypothetical protein BH10CYA1_BH10CYA1_53530 [soil metagenome]